MKISVPQCLPRRKNTPRGRLSYDNGGWPITFASFAQRFGYCSRDGFGGSPHTGFHSPGSLRNGAIATYWSRSSRTYSARSLCSRRGERQARLRLLLADASNLRLGYRSLAAQALNSTPAVARGEYSASRHAYHYDIIHFSTFDSDVVVRQAIVPDKCQATLEFSAPVGCKQNV